MNFVESNLGRPFAAANDEHYYYYFTKNDPFGFYVVTKVHSATETVEGVINDSDITSESFTIHKTVLGEIVSVTIPIKSITFL